MRLRLHIKKTKFAFSCIMLFGYAAYTAYALYYFLAFEDPLGIALLALVGATLALTAVILLNCAWPLCKRWDMF